jgi:hypothetical protein
MRPLRGGVSVCSATAGGLGTLSCTKRCAASNCSAGSSLQAHGGQQRGAQQELVGRDLAHRQVVRPGALLLADVHVVLDHVAGRP